MPQKTRFILALSVLVILIGLPVSAFARGGGGGSSGRGGGGMRGGGGAGYRGTGTGFRGYGAGFRGYTARYPGAGVGYRGVGWGYPGHYGWGYPYYGYGLGFGLGLGLGYGLSSGSGYPAYGYSSGSSTNYGGSNYVSGANANVPQNSVTTVGATTSDAAATARSREFAERGEIVFKAGDYEKAIYSWRHAVVDDPQNPVLVLQLAQALFATGKYEEAAGATQAAMQRLPREEWGAVVNRYPELYGNKKDYTNQLRALEKAIAHKPDDPALRFLAGYHYGFLGFHKQSIVQLDRVIEKEPRDEMARQLRDEIQRRLSPSGAPSELLLPPPAPVPATEASWTRAR